MSARARFCQHALEQLGLPVLMGAKGPDAYDCSGLVTRALQLAGGADLLHTHNAQRLHNESPSLGDAAPLPGDLVFYGLSSQHVSHVGIWLSGGKVLSADGAQSSVKTLEEALQHPTYRVRLHDDAHFRRDLPGNPLAIHRNVFVDAIDTICL